MSKATIMLAKVATDKLIDRGAIYNVSEKIDGQPCVIKFNDSGVLHAVSRQGKEITSIQHILDEVRDIFKVYSGLHVSIPSNPFELVGELYIKGKGSAEISGLVRKDAPCPELMLFVFPEFRDVRTRSIRNLPVWQFSGLWVTEYMGFKRDDAKVILGQMTPFCINHPDSPEFEGFIARKVDTPWIAGKRSNDYLKLVKDPTMDMRVVGLEEAISKTGERLNRVGAFIVEWQGGICKVGAGKLSHSEARFCWAQFKNDPNILIPSSTDNKVVEATIIEIKYKRDAKYTSPRQPTFQRFRHDKDEYETDFPESIG